MKFQSIALALCISASATTQPITRDQVDDFVGGIWAHSLLSTALLFPWRKDINESYKFRKALDMHNPYRIGNKLASVALCRGFFRGSVATLVGIPCVVLANDMYKKHMFKK